MVARRRLDAELVRRGLAGSRTQARRLIDEGYVTVAGVPASKPATLVDPGMPVVVAAPGERPFASRGGHKLHGALQRLGIPVQGRHGLDAGAAHGGFTDVLLRGGAARVVAVDVAYGQLDWRLRGDPRVVVLERTNVRHLTPSQVPPPQPDLVVADLSFISLTLVLPALRTVAARRADFMLLVKPQFEAGRHAVGRGGVVRTPEGWAAAVQSVVAAGGELDLALAGAAVSPLPGPAGNIEFFVHLRPGAAADDAGRISAVIAEGERLRRDRGG